MIDSCGTVHSKNYTVKHFNLNIKHFKGLFNLFSYYVLFYDHATPHRDVEHLSVYHMADATPIF